MNIHKNRTTRSLALLMVLASVFGNSQTARSVSVKNLAGLPATQGTCELQQHAKSCRGGATREEAVQLLRNCRADLHRPDEACGGTKTSSRRAQVKHPKITGKQLMECLIPGCTSGSSFEIKKPYRSLFFDNKENSGYTGKVEIGLSKTVWLHDQGQERVALLAEFKALEDIFTVSGSVVVLALFKVNGSKPQLIDAVDVANDRFVDFASPFLLNYKEGSDALIIQNSHSNAGESYLILDAVALVDNKLRELCSAVPNLYSGRTATASIDQDGKYVVSAARGGNGLANGKQTASNGSLKPISFVVTATAKTYDSDDSEKVLSSRRKIFAIPLHPARKIYATNKNDKQLKALAAFIAKAGFADR
jgi:hypothetical protein